MRIFTTILLWLISTNTVLAADFSEQRIAAFDAYLNGLTAAQFTDYKLAGMTFAMVHNGELIYSKGFGVADLEQGIPVDPATHLFRPGSVSKLFTWTALMQLVEQGKLDLDADISQYITQFELPNEFDTPLTLRHLLTHTPGLEDGAAGYLFGDEPSDIAPLAEVLEKYMPTQVRKPGTYSAYSNWSTALAGLIIANVSGQSFESYIADHIFTPLQMQYATFDEPLPEHLAEYMSTGYIEEDGALTPFVFEFIKNFGPAGALSASGNDMANFMIAHLNQGKFGNIQLLQPDTIRQMHSNLFGHHDSLSQWAHGFYDFSRNGQRFIGHAGDTIAFHSQMVLDTKNNFGFYLSFNAVDGASARTAVVDGVVDYFYPPTSQPYHVAPLDGSVARVAEVAGAYRVNRRSYTKLEGITALGGDLVITPSGDNAILLPIPDLGGRFEETEPYVFTKLGTQSKIAFGKNADGDVSHLFISILAADKLGTLEQASTHQLIIVLALLAAIFVCINAVRTRGTLTAGAARNARRMTIAASVCLLAFVIGMVLVFSDFSMSKAIFDFPPSGIGPALVLPILMALFTVAALGYLVPVWRADECGIWARLRYTYVALIFLAFVLVMHYWNVLGWNYY